MQSRRDLFQAHRLMTQRASLALLRGEPDIPDQPLRRLNVAAFSSVLVAAIVTVLFFIWGLLGHGGSRVQNQPGTLVIDKQTGTPFVFCEGGRNLCPVVNYASARLALQSSSVAQQTVSQASLAKFRRGPLIGIPGLPQPLPQAGLLVRQPWSVCTQTALGVSGEQTTTTLAVGVPIGGSPLGGSELLARAQGQDWVIWNGQRMPIQPSSLQALPSQSPTTVPTVWLDALPQGPAFAPPAIPGHGETVTGPTGIPARVGQVYQVAVAGGTQYYVLLRSGLARISQTQDKLLEFEPGAPNKGNQLTLSPSQVTTHSSASAVPGGGLPASIPAAAAPGSSAPWCVVYAGAGGSRTLTPQVQAGGQIPSGATATGIPADVGQVALPPGAGALVGDAPGTGQGSGAISYFLVAEGRRYALASTEVAGMLGYSLSQAVLLPAGVVDLIPAGPALDPAQATRPVPSG
jgi:type VII secretion protein EccB